MALHLGPDVIQDPTMDALNEIVAEQTPVHLRPDFQDVPGASLEACPSTRKRHQPELTAPRAEIAVEMRR